MRIEIISCFLDYENFSHQKCNKQNEKIEKFYTQFFREDEKKFSRRAKIIKVNGFREEFSSGDKYNAGGKGFLLT